MALRYRFLVTGLSLLLFLSLSACGGSGDWFGEEEEPPLPGERISLMQFDQDVKIDLEMRDVPVLLPYVQSLDDWVSAGGNAMNDGGNVRADTGFSKIWDVDFGQGVKKDNPLIAQPIAANGRIFTLDTAGRVRAFDAQSGERLWSVIVVPRAEEKKAIGGGLAYDDGYLVVTSGYHQILMLDPENGGLVWRYEGLAPFRAPPLIAAGAVYAISVDNVIYALDRKAGKVLWEHRGFDEAAGILGAAVPAFSDQEDVVIAAYSSGEVFALRAENGLPVWSENISSTRGIGSFARLGDVRAHPVIGQDFVLAMNVSDTLTAIDLKTGFTKWSQKIGGINMPWLAGNTIFVLSKNYDLFALDTQSGRARWVAPVQKYEDEEDNEGLITWYGPMMVDGEVLLFSSQGYVEHYNPVNGERVKRSKIRLNVATQPIIFKDRFFIANGDGDLISLK